MANIAKNLKNIKIKGRMAENYPLSELSSFKVGGHADIAAWPQNSQEVMILLAWARSGEIPVTVLGGTSNVLVSDRGIRGLTIFTTAMTEIRIEGSRIIAGAGVPITDVSAFAAEHGLAGLDFIYSMPGSTGGRYG